MTSRLDLLAAVAEHAVYGVLDTQTLEANGVHSPARSRLIEDRLLIRRKTGVYTIQGSAPNYEQSCAIALATAGPDAALSREAAARLHLLDGFAARRMPASASAVGDSCPMVQERSTVAGRTPSVNVPRSSSRRGPQIHRVDDTGHCYFINGLRVTGVKQTLIELGRGLGTHHSPGGHRLRPVDLVELALESALHQRLTTIEALTDALNDTGKTHIGAAVLCEVLLRRPIGAAPTESWFETRTVQTLRVGGLTEVERQSEIRTATGRLIGRVDLRIGRLIIECDSREFHPDFEADRQRWAALQALGFLVLPATFRQVEFQTTAFLRSVRALLRAC